MALVSQFFELPTGPTRLHPTTVECGWRVSTIGDERYLLLETYGSRSRQIPGKVSQAIQLDRAGAVQLKALIERAFPGA